MRYPRLLYILAIVNRAIMSILYKCYSQLMWINYFLICGHAKKFVWFFKAGYSFLIISVYDFRRTKRWRLAWLIQCSPHSREDQFRYHFICLSNWRMWSSRPSYDLFFLQGRIYQDREPPQFVALFQPMVVLKVTVLSWHQNPFCTLGFSFSALTNTGANNWTSMFYMMKSLGWFEHWLQEEHSWQRFDGWNLHSRKHCTNSRIWDFYSQQ